MDRESPQGNEIREWSLNNRVEHLPEQNHTGYQLLRKGKRPDIRMPLSRDGCSDRAAA